MVRHGFGSGMFDFACDFERIFPAHRHLAGLLRSTMAGWLATGKQQKNQCGNGKTSDPKSLPAVEGRHRPTDAWSPKGVAPKTQKMG
ncbi:MAG: hypothetical protein IPH16_05270 [Haliscomenobacter sp.]|nr:hypothetical protein [Haliscomenobacter sp.]